MALALGSPEGSALTNLQLYKNDVSDSGAAALATALASGHSQLESISLVHNRISGAGANTFIEALSSKHSHGRHQLRYLGLAGNEGIDAVRD